MTLVPNWRRVLWRALSLWAVYISALLEVAIQMLPYAADWLPWWAPLVVLLLTPIFRIIEQRSLHADASDQTDPAR